VPSQPRSHAPDVLVSRNGTGAANGSGRQGAHVIEMQRRRLLLAIVELVAEEGLEGASAGRICKRAGVSRRTFYEIFEDREACLRAALEEAVRQIAESVLPAYERERKWSAGLRAGLTALLEQFDSEPGLARLCVVETLRAGPEVMELRRRVLDALTATVDEGRSEAKGGDTLPPLTAQGVVGGALSVIHARLLARLPPVMGGPRTGEDDSRPLVELVNPLMGMIVHPYLGPAAARRQLDRPALSTPSTAARGPNDPFKDLAIRFTYRTALVLATIAAEGGRGSYPSNRYIADTSGIGDEGQMSRLLRRLQRSGLIENHGDGQPKGEPNAWTLTERGQAVHTALGVHAGSR
jgi:AcrR family transcriptional regulator